MNEVIQLNELLNGFVTDIPSGEFPEINKVNLLDFFEGKVTIDKFGHPVMCCDPTTEISTSAGKTGFLTNLPDQTCKIIYNDIYLAIQKITEYLENFYDQHRFVVNTKNVFSIIDECECLLDNQTELSASAWAKLAFASDSNHTIIYG